MWSNLSGEGSDEQCINKRGFTQGQILNISQMINL